MRIKPNQNLMLAAAAMLLLNFTSCKKYDDGPAFSLRSKTKRLTGEWEVVEIENDRLDRSEVIILEFEKDGDFEFSYFDDGYGYLSKGEWEWEDNKEVIEVEYDNYKEEWEITRLTNTELWFEDEDNYEFKCEKK